jgi:hypothetical protein
MAPGTEFEFPLGYVYTFREDDCVRIQPFADVGESRKAAGLPE